MNKISLPTGEVPRSRALEPRECESLREWLPPDNILDMNTLETEAYWRNIHRAAEPYGPRLIAMMIESAALAPEEDPIEAMQDLLRGAGY